MCLNKHYDNDAIKTNDNNQSWNGFCKIADNNKEINNKSKVDLDIDYIFRNRNQFKENPKSVRRKMNYLSVGTSGISFRRITMF